MNKYPVDYDTFKNRILQSFLKHDWKYTTKFTKKQKEEFINKHNFDFRESYEEECQNYDNGFENVFDKPEDTHKYILGLLFDCDQYYNSKQREEPVKEVDEGRYPVTYNEFEEIIRKLFIRDAPKQFTDVTTRDAEDGWKQYLEENGDVRDTYEERCEMYDNPSSNIPKDKVFTEEALSAGPVYYMIQWVYF